MIIRIFLGLAFFLASGCAGLRELPHLTTNELARNISDNAANINEAQSRATSAIIVKNILRARDRWPTSYSTLSGITANPEIVFSAEATLAPLGLGNPPTPFGESNAKFSQDNTASASYKVNPFSEQNGGENIYNPIPRQLFKSYWDAGYPKDVLLMLFVASVKEGEHTYINDVDAEKKNFRRIIAPLTGDKCPNFATENVLIGEGVCAKKNQYELKENTKYDASKCPVIHTFTSDELMNPDVDTKKTILQQIKILADLKDNDIHLDVVERCDTGLGRLSDIFLRDCKSTEKKEQLKFVLKSSEDRAPSDEQTPRQACNESRLEKLAFSGQGNSTSAPIEEIEFTLRSIDSMIYFLGEYIRQTDTASDESANDAPPFKVIMNDAAGSMKGVALFETMPKDFWRYRVKDLNESFAVSVVHGGERYYAAQKLHCSKKQGESGESDVKCSGEIDRTGTVLSILSQLFIRSQSNEFLKAPEASILRTQ